MTYEVLFDASSAPKDNSILLVAAALALLGLLAVRLGPGAQLALMKPFRDRPVAWRAMMAAWLVLALAVVAGELWSRLGPRESTHVMVVDGVVREFVQAARGGPKNESFTVGGVRFRYAQWAARRGFHQTSEAGGPIREGLEVRIHYVGPPEDPTIVRLEARR